MELSQGVRGGPDEPDDLDLADVQRDQIIDELRAIHRTTKRSRAPWLMVSLVLVLISLLWLAAEVHDGNCYEQAQLARLLELGHGIPHAPPGDGCYILPWNGSYN